MENINIDKKSEKKFFIFIGRSGCGKGTQSEMLISYLESKYKAASNDITVTYATTGAGFRQLISSDSYAARLSKEITNNGGLNPEFLAIWNWSNIFINNLSDNQTVVLDGAPRKMIEVEALHTAINFFKYTSPIVVYIDVSERWAKSRLLARGREDDKNEAEVSLKMSWFEKDVMPCVDYYKNTDIRYNFVHVNGEKSPQEVHDELIYKLENI